MAEKVYLLGEEALAKIAADLVAGLPSGGAIAPIVKDGSGNFGIAPATESAAGSMSATDKAKLDALPEGALAQTPIKTGDYTANYFELVRVDLTGDDITITLPTAAGHANAVIAVKHVSDDDTHSLTVVPFGSEQIEGGSSFVTSGPRVAHAFVASDDFDGASWMALPAVQTLPPEPPPIPVQLGVTAWYRSDDPTTLTLVSSTHLSSWGDASGNGYALLQSADAKRPIYAADFGDAGPAINFTAAANQFVQVFTAPPINPNTDYTVIALTYPLIDSIVAWSIADHTAANRHLMDQYLFSNHKHRLLADNGSDLDLNKPGFTAGAWGISTLRRSGNTCKAKLNGGAEVTATQSGATVTTNSITIGGLEVAAGSNTVSAPWSGGIREIQFYNRHLSDGEVAQAIADLEARYPSVP